MRNSDDDLKINLSDLFGEELTGPSESLEDVSTPETIQAPSIVPETQLSVQPDLQEWITPTNKTLELNSQESIQNNVEPTVPTEPLLAETLKGDYTEEIHFQTDRAANIEESSISIDFNAPIAPPFMGPINNSNSSDHMELNKVKEETENSESKIEADELKSLQAEHEFLMFYDEFRKIIASELKDLVGEKKTLTMLERTVELARGKFPQIFRNVNWDSSGNLLEDGSVDSLRIIENKKLLTSLKVNEVMDAALSTLLKIRLQAVEKGLGVSLKNKIRARLYQWISEKTKKMENEGRDLTSLKRLSDYVAAT